MDYVIIAFRSRSETIKVGRFFTENNIFNEIVNTPKEAGVGCGLSVKVDVNTFYKIRGIIGKLNVSTFGGFFAVKDVGGRRIVRSI